MMTDLFVANTIPAITDKFCGQYRPTKIKKLHRLHRISLITDENARSQLIHYKQILLQFEIEALNKFTGHSCTDSVGPGLLLS